MAGSLTNQTSQATAAAAELSRGEHASHSKPQDASPPDREGLSQVNLALLCLVCLGFRSPESWE